MTCLPEPLSASRAAGLRTTGPRGFALPNEDAAEVERRFAAFEAEMAPKTELERTLTLRVATLSVRLERCYRNEAARLGLAVDSALRAYDDERRSAVEALIRDIDVHPETHARRLQQTPEGVQMTIDAWRDLGEDLAERGAWGVAHRERAENLLGRRPLDLPRSPIYGLSQALRHDYSDLEPAEVAGMDDRQKYEYAKRRMLDLIEGRVRDLTAYRETLDLPAAGRARAGAADRALFDASPEAILARKYEAATERSLFRTLREFREVEPAPAPAPVPAPVEVQPTPEAVEGGEGLGSSLSGRERVGREAPIGQAMARPRSNSGRSAKIPGAKAVGKVPR